MITIEAIIGVLCFFGRVRKMYDLLQSKITIGHLTIKNRVAMTAMGVFIAAPGGGVNDDIIAFYEARAKGGVGLIITEVTRVCDGAGGGEPCQLAARNFADALELRRLTDAVHKYDTKIFIQLQHPGRTATSALTGEQPVAPSPIPLAGGELPRALTNSECKELVEKFINGALMAQIGGADGVELHAAHGYLINEFLSPAMNQRTDEYGGNLANRMRFLLDIIQGIRQRCGANFPISVRINAEEASELLPGGIDLPASIQIAQRLEQAGVDMLNVSTYNNGCIEPGTYEQGWKRPYTEAIKRSVQLPVLGVSNIKTPEVAEKLLAGGVCDMVGVARSHLADPEWCNKAFEGRTAAIRKCIGCLACFGEITKCHRAKCAVNPVACREREYAQLVCNGRGRVIAIVGGGPAGIEAALVLKARGFEPLIFEKGSRLGGALNIADKGYGKDKITDYVNSLIVQVDAAAIEVRLNTEVTVAEIKRLHPVGVFVACGAEPILPPLPGLNGNNVVLAENVLLGKTQITGRVAIVGSGMTGLETAEILAAKWCELTLIEMTSEVGAGIYPTVVDDVMGRILPHNPRILTEHRLESVDKNGVDLLRLPDKQHIRIDAEWIVLAMGVHPRRDVVEAFQKEFAHVQIIGDAHQGGRVLEATQDAHGKAFVFMA